MDIPPPLEGAPSFCDLSLDETRHHFREGILTRFELERDGRFRAFSLEPFGVFERLEPPSKDLTDPKPDRSEDFAGLFCCSSRFAPDDPALIRATGQGANRIATTSERGARSPLCPEQWWPGPWGSSAAALAGRAVQFAIGYENAGDLARAVLQCGLPGFRSSAALDGRATAWMHRYLVDSELLVKRLTVHPGRPLPNPIRLIPSGESAAALNQFSAAAVSENPMNPLPLQFTVSPNRPGWSPSSLAPGEVMVRVLNENEAQLASELDRVAAYIPWRPGTSESSFLQLLALPGSETWLGGLVRHIAGPASAY